MEQNPVALGKHIVRTSLYHFVRRSLYHFGYDVIRMDFRNKEEIEKDFEVRLKKQNNGFDETTIKIYEQVSPFTLTNIERVFALKNAVEYIIKNDIPGDIVECGVWRGGSMMAAALTLLNLGAKRRLYLFDTFAGMTAPTSVDRDLFGKSATESSEGFGDRSKDVPPLWEVKANLRSTGYDENLITYVQGPVEETLPANAPATIAILRLDTDWYESTRHEMQHLYPRLSGGGALIIDDYGYYEGARLAVDEFIAAGGLPLLLHRIDSTGARMCVKPLAR